MAGDPNAMSTASTYPADATNRLRRLVALRWVAIAAQICLVYLAAQWLGAQVWIEAVLAICTAQVGLNLASIAYGDRSAPASDRQLFAQLLFDVGALTAIAYLAGGSTNPLISLYLLWIAVGAAMLEARLAALLAAISVACYSLVSFVHGQVHIHDHERALQVHLVGMWVIFVFSAITICWSVVHLTAAVRKRDAELAAAREAALRGERVVALGNLAAGAAHELGTPLTTMAVLAGEMLRDAGLSAAVRSDLELLQAQVSDCKRIITALAVQAGANRAEGIEPVALDIWIEQLLQRWQRQRPIVVPEVALQGDRPGPLVAVDATLGQAFLNLFNNAADASPDKVRIEASWNEQALQLRVLDRGDGIASEIQKSLGRDLITTREQGHGMGVVLAYAALERCGGSLAFQSRAGGGTQVQVDLPLSALTPPRPAS